MLYLTARDYLPKFAKAKEVSLLFFKFYDKFLHFSSSKEKSRLFRTPGFYKFKPISGKNSSFSTVKVSLCSQRCGRLGPALFYPHKIEFGLKLWKKCWPTVIFDSQIVFINYFLDFEGYSREARQFKNFRERQRQELNRKRALCGQKPVDWISYSRFYRKKKFSSLILI